MPEPKTEPDATLTDEELYRGFSEGDARATHHVQGWIDGVVGLGRWNFHDPEGVGQEILLKIFRVVREGRWKRQSSFKTFVFSVAKHTCIDVYRRERVRSNLHNPAESGGPAAVSPGQEAALERMERLEVLRTVLYQLPTDCLRLWSWVYREGLAAGEVGEKLGITPGNVRVRLHRCLDRARALARKLEADPSAG